MKQTITIIALLALFVGMVSAQSFHLYNSRGKLIIDTTYIIDKSLLSQINKYAKSYFPLISDSLQYPEIAIEMGVTERLLLKVKVNKKTEIVEFSIVKQNEDCLTIEVLRTVEKYKDDLLKQTVITEEFEFYLPFLFILEEYKGERVFKEYPAIVKKAIGLISSKE